MNFACLLWPLNDHMPHHQPPPDPPDPVNWGSNQATYLNPRVVARKWCKNNSNNNSNNNNSSRKIYI